MRRGMRILICTYGGYPGELLRRCLRSLEAVGRGGDVTLLHPEPEIGDQFGPKIRGWRDEVRGMDDGNQVLLLDADTLVLRDPVAAFGEPFDVAHCPNAGVPWCNTGVVFLRVSPVTRRLMSIWADRTGYWAQDVTRTERATKRDGSTDQAAFRDALTAMLDDEPTFTVCELDPAVWNLAKEFERYEPGKTGIVHLKGKVRRKVLSPASVDYPEVRELWEQFA
jgi:hypothetical protein